MSGQSVGGDIRLSIAACTHFKLERLRLLLGGQACWALVCLWAYAGDQRWDGDLSGMTDEDIEGAARWIGEPGELVKALVRLRLLDGAAGHRRVHDWAEHQPYAAQRGQRAEASRKAAQARWNRQKASAEDAPRMRPACDPDAGVMPPTQPNPTSTTDLQPDPAREGPRDSVGCFEPAVDAPRGTPTPAAAHAIALNRAGFRCTTLNPRLVAFADAGGTVEHLLQVAALPDCSGKPAGYVITIALRELGERASAPSASPRSSTSSVMAGLSALESLKHEPATRTAGQLESARRDPDGPAEALHPALGWDPLP
jgi:hypothetical protein